MATPFTADRIIKHLQTKNEIYAQRLEQALRLIGAKTNFALGGQYFGASLLKQINEGKTLSDRQLAALEDMLCKTYAGTLARLANEKAGIKTEQPAPVKQEAAPKATTPAPAPTPAPVKKERQKRAQKPQKAKEQPPRTAEEVITRAEDAFYAENVKNTTEQPEPSQWANEIDW